jgi:CRP-like cAMP-binding protein
MNALVRKLENIVKLSEADKRLIDAAIGTIRRVSADEDLIREGDKPDNIHLILGGFACRYKITQQGKRQILAFLMPGDFCDLHVFILKQMDHSIGTLSNCRVAEISPERILELTDRPAIARALWWAELVEEGVLREWLVGIGRRDAAQRIAHLLCELHVRLRAIGLADGNRFELPMTQEELGDTTGLTLVHVNRTLRSLREAGLIEMDRRQTVIVDPERLSKFGGFTPNYLHLPNPVPD